MNLLKCSHSVSVLLCAFRVSHAAKMAQTHFWSYGFKCNVDHFWI